IERTGRGPAGDPEGVVTEVLSQGGQFARLPRGERTARYPHTELAKRIASSHAPSLIQGGSRRSWAVDRCRSRRSCACPVRPREVPWPRPPASRLRGGRRL